MYRIIINGGERGGETLGETEEVIWIRKHSNGCYVRTTEAEAQGVAFKSSPYNLLGRDGLGDGVTESVIVVEYDGGDDVAELHETQAEQAAIEDAMCEEDTEAAERIAALEDALCELDKN